MPSPRVVNMRDHGGKPPPGAVRIDRRTRWGNEFRIGRDGTREEVLEKHRRVVLSRPGMRALIPQALRGKDLACWCAPLPCHGDVLLKIANREEGGDG